MAYSDKVLDHYNNPRNVGSMDKNNPAVGTGMVGAPECGDVMKLQVKVNPATGVIEDAKFKTFGCGSAIASSSLATEMLKGKTVDEALSLMKRDATDGFHLDPTLDARSAPFVWTSDGLAEEGDARPRGWVAYYAEGYAAAESTDLNAYVRAVRTRYSRSVKPPSSSNAAAKAAICRSSKAQATASSVSTALAETSG